MNKALADVFWRRFVDQSSEGQIAFEKFFLGKDALATEAEGYIGSPEKRRRFKDLSGHSTRDFIKVLQDHIAEATTDEAKAEYEDILDTFMFFLRNTNATPAEINGTINARRSEMGGWDVDPITFEPNKTGDEVIRLNGDNRMIFNKAALLQAWAVSGTRKNPKTTQPLTSADIEEGVLAVEEDAGEMPADLAGGRRRRRTRKPKRAHKKTRRSKNVR
jgi:hypothetical protein